MTQIFHETDHAGGEVDVIIASVAIGVVMKSLSLLRQERKSLSQSVTFVSHVLKPLHFSHRIQALLRLSTNANLCYLKFDLTNYP